MTYTISDAEDAAALVALGLRPRVLPDRDAVYAELVRRYCEDPAFNELVDAVAAGLGLGVLTVSRQTGAVLAATADSLFTVRMEEYARRTALKDRREDKVMHGLIHLAVAALAFPRPDDLANDSFVGRVSVEQVDGVVREAARVLDERAEQAVQNEDPSSLAPDLERTWRMYARRPSASSTRDGRLAPDATRSLITKAMRYLTDQGLLTVASTEGGGTYRTTPRYQVAVRDVAAEGLFGELIDLGIIAVTDPRGSLRHVPGALG